MGEWVSEWKKKWLSDGMSECVNWIMGARTNEKMSEWVYRWVSELTKTMKEQVNK